MGAAAASSSDVPMGPAPAAASGTGGSRWGRSSPDTTSRGRSPSSRGRSAPHGSAGRDPGL
eukprot:15909959-Heterocapsa_arctica.AAC.1